MAMQEETTNTVESSPIAPAVEKVFSAKTQTVDWVSSHQGAAVLVAFMLILLYVLPILIVALAAYQTDGFQEPSPMLKWFVAFMKSSDSTLNGIHKVLFPFIATLSIVAFKDKVSRSVIALGIFVMTMFMLSVFVGVLFDIPEMKSVLAAQGANVAETKAFFSKTQDTLLMYLMLLLGVSAISETKPTMKVTK